MDKAPDPEVAGPPPVADPVADAEAAPAEEAPPVEAPSAGTDPIGAGDAECFRHLLAALESGSDGSEAAALVADEIRQALEFERDTDALLERLSQALAEDAPFEDVTAAAAPALATLAVRSLLGRLARHDLGAGDAPDLDRLIAAAGDATRTLIESEVPGAVGALAGIVRHLAERAVRDRIAGPALIPALRRTAERVASDPDLVRRLTGRGSHFRPPATAALGAAALRQQPVRCRIDGPVEIIIVRR